MYQNPQIRICVANELEKYLYVRISLFIAENCENYWTIKYGRLRRRKINQLVTRKWKVGGSVRVRDTKSKVLSKFD